MTGTVSITDLFAHFVAGDDQNIQVVGGPGVLGAGGSVVIEGGDPAADGVSNGGFTQLVGGSGAPNGGNGGDVILTSGWGGDTSGNAGNIQINPRPGNNEGSAGSLLVTLGAGAGAGTAGHFVIAGLPTADPHVVGALWNNAGTVKISAG